MANYTFYAEKPVEQYRRTDKILLVSILLLWGLGIFTLYISSPDTAMRLFEKKYYFVVRQLISSLVGFAAMIFFILTPMPKIRKMLMGIVIISIVLCLMVHIPGIGLTRKGAPRWIKLPFISTFQPSEAAKFALVLFLANLFDKQQRIEDEQERSVVPCVVGLLVFVAVIILQKDFSTAVLMFFTGLIMFFASGAKLAWLIPFSPLALAAIFILIAMEPYRLDRLIAFFNPDAYVQTLGYQQFASDRAISEGGFWGSGLGSGLTQVSYIPEVQADYIFAGWADAMGFFGVLLYFVVLGVFAWRAYSVAFTSKDRFASYGTFGCATMIVLQSLINCGVVCGALPTTGIPLPFFSSGGSSIIFTLCMCGFMLNASRCEEYEYSFDGDGKKNKINNSTESFLGLVVENE